MKRFLALAAVITPLAFCALPSQAVPQSPLPAVNATAESGLVTPVQWGRCGFWRRECAVRWPVLGRAFAAAWQFMAVCKIERGSAAASFFPFQEEAGD